MSERCQGPSVFFTSSRLGCKMWILRIFVYSYVFICEGNSPVTGGFPSQRASHMRSFVFHRSNDGTGAAIKSLPRFNPGSLTSLCHSIIRGLFYQRAKLTQALLFQLWFSQNRVNLLSKIAYWSWSWARGYGAWVFACTRQIVTFIHLSWQFVPER